MQINLSPEMIKVVRAVLREVPMSTLRSHTAGWQPDYQVDGVEALDLFEELYIESQGLNLPRRQA